ncbi:thiol reductant ABC exporter subunit CydD [Cellulomonas composti]|uniref:Thiol reductant ABC exporter subunit CydD n=1 Tax=Cellulomonas composti TaxID=266130 RepID=A0A511JBL2_9CELL|nr:thiol reductant ABC exporter subunit CydD [Cellulomonas composti]GEL95093.1 thiol reductant ABC exporter subunit CydD [Cellulomonas composti]
MKPLDPRLLRHARAARGYAALTAVLGLLTAALVVAQALLLAHALGRAVDDGVALGAGTWDAVAPLVGWLVVVVLARAVVSAAQERYAHRAATRAVGELREAVVAHAVALGPRRVAAGGGAQLVTLATRGLDALEPYFVRYLPQLFLAATVTPATLLVVLGLDWVSAAVLVLVLPLVPIFMWLVGRLTQGRSERGLATMQRLSAQVLDLLVGLPTLRALGRERGPAARVRALGDAHRTATMGTLRIAFLSGMVLELLTTLSVALVAVGIGLRLVAGELDLVTGLAVLVLAPEVFAPLRAVGAQFHASTDGVAAAQAAFEVLDEPLPAAGTAPAPDLATASIVVTDLAGPGGTPDGLRLTLGPGRVVALTGPSGGGKSTTVEILLGLLAPVRGTVRLVPLASSDASTPDERESDERASDEGVDVRDVERGSYWRQVAWVPQRAVVEPGVLSEVVGGDDETRAAAAALTGLADVVADLPQGWATRVGRGGHGLSVGQVQRVALTRALQSSAPLVVLDEPTAHLDAAAQDVVLAAVQALRAQGRTVLLVAHRPQVLALADEVHSLAALETVTG